jgi:hypothetical protein
MVLKDRIQESNSANDEIQLKDNKSSEGRNDHCSAMVVKS